MALLQNELDSTVPIFEALVCETHTAALLTAAIASAVNAFKREHGDRSEAGLKPYEPREPALVGALRNRLIETDLDEETIDVVSEFFASLAPARDALTQYYADANHIGPERASALHLFALTNTWRGACEDALTAVRQLHGAIERRLPAQYTSNSRLLTNLLKEAARGGSPCIDAEGHIAIPDLPQRRRSARRTLCQPCKITHNRVTAEAFVRDVSPGGFGLERVPNMLPQSIVLIELPNGRRFTGIVVWCDGSSAGVRLSKALLPNDPLLSG